MEVQDLIKNVQKYVKNDDPSYVSRKVSDYYLTEIYNGKEHDYVLFQYHQLLQGLIFCYLYEKRFLNNKSLLVFDIKKELDDVKKATLKWRKRIFHYWKKNNKDKKYHDAFNENEKEFLNYLNIYDESEEEYVREELGL